MIGHCVVCHVMPCEDLMLFSVLFDCKLNICWSDVTFGFRKVIMCIFLTFFRHFINQMISCLIKKIIKIIVSCKVGKKFLSYCKLSVSRYTMVEEMSL